MLPFAPGDEVTFNGVIWAGTNVNTAGTFCTNYWDIGDYFIWEEALTACPEGWRLPTYAEMYALVNDTYTTVSWLTGTGAGTGLKVVPKSGYGDTSQTLWLPNAGWKGDEPRYPANDIGTWGRYYTSTINIDAGHTYASYLLFFKNLPGGTVPQSPNNLYAYSIRCVRTP